MTAEAARLHRSCWIHIAFGRADNMRKPVRNVTLDPLQTNSPCSLHLSSQNCSNKLPPSLSEVASNSRKPAVARRPLSSGLLFKPLISTSASAGFTHRASGPLFSQHKSISDPCARAQRVTCERCWHLQGDGLATHYGVTSSFQRISEAVDFVRRLL